MESDVTLSAHKAGTYTPHSKVTIEFFRQSLTAAEQSVVADGFQAHSDEHGAPAYKKSPLKWLLHDERRRLRAVLTADVLWDWIYVDELWVTPECRDQGLGRQLMVRAEEFALAEGLQGLWLWTQSWQAEGFYQRLGYEEFARFDNFPAGHARIGFRKALR